MLNGVPDLLIAHPQTELAARLPKQLRLHQIFEGLLFQQWLSLLRHRAARQGLPLLTQALVGAPIVRQGDLLAIHLQGRHPAGLVEIIIHPPEREGDDQQGEDDDG